MDYFLPQLEGLDILRELRAAAGLESVRVVMTSGMDVEDQCMQAGADAFLLKPYTPEQLMDCIQEQLGESPSGEGSPL
jgi:CheY-like chemotaxis protein